jgi:hypothetical protein
MKVTTLACLVISKDGAIAVHLIEPPVPAEFRIGEVPRGLRHAAKLAGLPVDGRLFKRTAEGTLPVYEEV